MHDVLIIGSGVIGMSIARQLSATNYDIAIIDRDVPGKHASYKAGGMLEHKMNLLKITIYIN